MNKASLYASAHSMQRRDATDALAELCRAMSWSEGEEDVLDVGCGSGDVTATLLLPALPAGVRRVVGSDVSAAMVHHALESWHMDRLTFVQEDITSPNIEESPIMALVPNGFHKIFSFYCLHWVQNQRAACENMYKLLRPNGSALLVFLAKCPVYNLYEIMAAKEKWKPYMQDVKKYISPYHHSENPAEEMKELLQEVGFKVLLCESRPKTFHYDSIEILEESIKAVNPFVDKIPIHLQEEYKTELLENQIRLKLIQYKKRNENPEESLIEFDYELLVVHVQKTQGAR